MDGYEDIFISFGIYGYLPSFDSFALVNGQSIVFYEGKMCLSLFILDDKLNTARVVFWTADSDHQYTLLSAGNASIKYPANFIIDDCDLLSDKRYPDNSSKRSKPVTSLAPNALWRRKMCTYYECDCDNRG